MHASSPPWGVEAQVFLENSLVSQLGALLFHFSKMPSGLFPPHIPPPTPPHIGTLDANSRKLAKTFPISFEILSPLLFSLIGLPFTIRQVQPRFWIFGWPKSILA